MHYWQVSYKEFSDYIQLYLFFFLLFPQRGQLYPYSLPFKITVRNSEWEVILIQSKLASVPCIKAGVLLSHQYKYLGSVYIRGLPRGGRGRRGARGGGMLLLCWSSINQSINQSFILTRYVKELKNSFKIRTCKRPPVPGRLGKNVAVACYLGWKCCFRFSIIFGDTQFGTNGRYR